MKKRKTVSLVLIVMLLTLMVPALAGCSKQSQPASTAQGLKKIVIANYAGAICYAPLYAAVDKGFFKNEGLDPDVEATDFQGTVDGLATGKFDVALGLFDKFLKPIESGTNIKFTAGLHSGCIQVVAGKDSGIKTLQDLKGKRVGIDAIGSGSMNFLVVALNKAGLDWQKDVTWKAYPPAQLETALDKGEIDALSITDPFGQTVIDDNKGYQLISQATTKPFSDEYCCFVTVSGQLVKNDPQTAAAITRALMKADLWVNSNKQEAAELEVNNKWTGGTVEGNLKLLDQYHYAPSVQGAQKDIIRGINDLNAAGVTNISDPQAFASQIFIPVTPDLQT